MGLKLYFYVFLKLDLGGNFWDIFRQTFLTWRVWIKPAEWVVFELLFLVIILLKMFAFSLWTIWGQLIKLY